MAALQPAGMGRHISHLDVIMQVVNASTGALTDSSAPLVSATLITSSGALHDPAFDHTKSISDDVDWMLRENTENIVSITRNRANWTFVRHGGEFTLVEILRPGAAKCELRTCWFTGPSRYALIRYARMQEMWTLYAKLSAYNEQLRQGKNVGRATFRLFDSNVTPTYTVADRP